MERMGLKRFGADTALPLLRDALLEDGAIIVEDLLGSAALAALNSELDPLLADADPAMRHLNPMLDAFFGQRVRHISGLAGKSTQFVEQVMCHPTYLGLCDAVLLPHCADYQLNLGHLMDRGPGAEAQWVHRDEDVWVHCPRPHPELLLASILALVDFHRDNGATFVVPGSHRWAREREPAGEEIAFAEMKAGSAVIYLGSVLHGGGTNCTESEWRRGVHISYAQGWLRTEENNVLAVPPATARTLSPRAQRLLGYGVHDAIADEGGYLGMVDMRNPMELLASGEL